MDEVQCPYCEKETKIVSRDLCEGFEEDEFYEECCEHCEKNFLYTASLSYSFSAQKAPCENGEPHKWVKIGSTSNYHDNFERCDYCWIERIIDDSLTYDTKTSSWIPKGPKWGIPW